MALYHFSLNHVKRSEGHTAIAAAAYRSGEKLYDIYEETLPDTGNLRTDAELHLRKRTRRARPGGVPETLRRSDSTV